MATALTLVLALVALALSSAALWVVITWRRDRRSLEVLAERLYVDSRMEALTTQTLAAMRDAARRGGQP